VNVTPILKLYDSVSIFESMLTPVFLPDLDPILKPTLILVPIEVEIEPPILDNHISLMEKKCEFQFLDLDPNFEPNPTLKPKLDLSHILESVLVPVPFIPEPKSSILSNHIFLLDQGIDHTDSEMIF